MLEFAIRIYRALSSSFPPPASTVYRAFTADQNVSNLDGSMSTRYLVPEVEVNVAGLVVGRGRRVVLLKK